MALMTYRWNSRQHRFTCGLEVRRVGWLRGARAEWGVPTVAEWVGGEVVEIDPAPVVEGTVMLVRQPFDGEPETLVEYEVDSPYNYAGIVREWEGEQDYGTVFRYRLVIPRATFHWLTVRQEGGGYAKRTDWSVGPFEDVVEYRQVDDSESWGSVHQGALVIPWQDAR